MIIFQIECYHRTGIRQRTNAESFRQGTMYDIRKLFERKPDHPMTSAAAARRILAELGKTEPAAALDQIAHWAETLRDVDGFSCDDRLEVTTEIEATGRKRAEVVFAEFFEHIHKRDRAQRKLSEPLNSFWSGISGAYGRCVIDHERGEKGAARVRKDLPLTLARSIRAAGAAERMRLLRYIGAGADMWQAVYRLLAYAETLGIDAQAVTAYPREVHTTPRAELLRLMGLSLAALHELPPEQVELADRILDRVAISFEWSREPAPECNFVIDLAAPGAPWQVKDNEPPAASKRYFGGGPALAKLQEIERLAADNLLSEEERYGKEFSQAQIVTVIRHFRTYLGPNPPRRRFPRASISDKVSVVKGFHAICQRVTTVELGSGMALGEDLGVERRKKPVMHFQAEEVEAEPEVWRTRDRSERGMGIDVPPGLGLWVEPGVLCGIREHEGAPWWVGIIRRLDAEEAGRLHCGLWIMSKRPISVFLRVIGTETRKASNRETSSGGFEYRYTRALMLPDAPKSRDHPVMLIERQEVGTGELCEVTVGEHSRHIQLLEVIEEGADYMRVDFVWKTPTAH